MGQWSETTASLWITEMPPKTESKTKIYSHTQREGKGQKKLRDERQFDHLIIRND